MKLFLIQVFHLLDQDKKKLPFLILIFLISSILDLIGIGLIGPYIALLVDADIFTGVIGKAITFIGFPSEKEPLLISIGYTLLALFLVKTIFSIWINKIIIQFSESQHVRLKSFLMSSYQSLSYVEYISRNSAEYVYSIQQLTNQYANHVVMPLLRMISDGIVVFLVIIFLAWQSTTALILLVSLLAIIMFLYVSIHTFICIACNWFSLNNLSSPLANHLKYIYLRKIARSHQLSVILVKLNQNIYTRTTKERPSYFFHSEIMPLFTLAGSGGICVL